MPFPGLSGWMVHFENPQSAMRVWVTIGKRIESSAQNNQLPHSVFDCARKLIFGITRSRREEGTKGAGRAAIKIRRARFERGCRFSIENAQREWIFKYKWPIQNLMCRAARGNAKSRPARARFFHLRSLF